MNHPRPPRPERVKRAALILNMQRNGGKLLCAETGEELTHLHALNGFIAFDHRPALALRFFNTQTGKYEPDANDVDYIDVTGETGHAIRTNEKRGLYHGDQTQIAHLDRVAETHAEHKARLAAKANGQAMPKPARLKKKIPAKHQPWPPKGSRKVRSNRARA